MRRLLPGLLLIAIALAALAAGASAQVTFEAQINRNTVPVGEPVRLDVTLSAPTMRISGSPEFKSLEGFDVISQQSGTSLQIINGRASSKQTYTYLLMPNAIGKFTIGPLQMDVGGRTYTTDSFEIEVLASPAPQKAGPAEAPEGLDAEKPIFMTARVEPNRAAVGQQIVVSYDLYARLDVLNVTEWKFPALTGFLSEEVSMPTYQSWDPITIGGRQYKRTTVHKVALFPLQSGELTIDSFEVVAEVLESFGGGHDFMFGQLPQQVRVASPPVTVIVEQPPEQGRPADFNGAIGPLSISGSLDRSAAPANTPVTLTITVEGEGNYRLLDLPKLDLPESFRIYSTAGKEDVIKGQDGVRISKNFEVVLIGEKQGDFTVGRVSLPYWDTEAQAYARAETGPFSLKLTPGDDVAQVTSQDRTNSARALRPNRSDKARVAAGHGSAWNRPLAWALLLALPIINVVAAIIVRRRRSLAADETALRRRRAGPEARRRLKGAVRLSSENPADFYAELMRSVLGFISDKTGVSSKGLTSDEMKELLESRGAGSLPIERLLRLWGEADNARFGGSIPDEAARRKALGEASALIDELGRGGLKG